MVGGREKALVLMVDVTKVGGLRLVVVEEAVIIAVGRHKRFEFRQDGREKVAAKGDSGWYGRGVGCRERSRGK